MNEEQQSVEALAEAARQLLIALHLCELTGEMELPRMIKDLMKTLDDHVFAWDEAHPLTGGQWHDWKTGRVVPS